MAKRRITIFYNPRCSKCREAMDVLEGSNCEIEIVEYLKEIPTKKELKDLLAKLGLKPFDLVRTKESIFEKKFRNKKFTDAEWLQIIIENPILLERPILVDGYKAIIGRPVERVIELLNRKKIDTTLNFPLQRK
ncbi:MAG TPA: arsenate reductase (glutaredoxin) [Bacteroidia bacterium]|nr:arsenate reductase (glutaredoxin) [Bacteroidia bacterium]